MPRSRAIFDKTYALGAAFRGGKAFDLRYHAASDADLFDQGVYETRCAKEIQAAAAWKLSTAEMRSLRDLHAWLHATHLCYAVGRQHESLIPDDPKLSATY